jgi:hypothetical protein
VIESIPGIQEVDYNNAGKVAYLCMHFAANKTTEAKGAADTLLAAAKGKPSSSLKACATNIKSMAEVLVDLPAGQDDMNAYLTFKEVRAKFKDQKPPACEKDCWNKTSSSSADETGHRGQVPSMTEPEKNYRWGELQRGNEKKAPFSQHTVLTYYNHTIHGKNTTIIHYDEKHNMLPQISDATTSS